MRGRHGNVRGFGEFFQFRRRAAGDDAAAAIKHRAFGFFNQADDFVQRDVVRLQIRLRVTAQTFFDLLRASARPAALFACWIFFGKSITTGPGRPDCAM